MHPSSIYIQSSGRTDHLVIEQDFHSVVSQLELELRPMVAAELSVLVDILYQPHKLFRPGSQAEVICQRQTGGFISRFVYTALLYGRSLSYFL